MKQVTVGGQAWLPEGSSAASAATGLSLLHLWGLQLREGGVHPPAHLEVIEHNTCAEHVVLQGHQVWQAGVNDQPSLPLVDVHSVMFHESLPLIPLLGPVFRQLVCLWRQRGGLGHSARGADSASAILAISRHHILTFLPGDYSRPHRGPCTSSVSSLCFLSFTQ